jgi:limonene-1,2-epoxide hydrolase
MSANTEAVDRFIAAWKSKDIDHLMSFFHDDAVYTNIPIDPPNRGAEQIRTMISGFLAMSDAMEFVVHHTAEDPARNIVMNERTDRFRLGERWIELPVMGVFELRDGRIQAWRDYFDMAQFQSGMAGGASSG